MSTTPHQLTIDVGPERRHTLPLHFRDHNGDYTEPLPSQAAFLASPHFVKALIGGYGLGKTEALLLQMIQCVMLWPGYRALLMSDTEPHTMVLINRLCEWGLFPPTAKGQPPTAAARVWGRRKSPMVKASSRPERYIYLPNGSRITLGSGRNPPGFDGGSHHGAFCDEGTLYRYDPANAAWNAWKVLEHRCRAPALDSWSTLPSLGMHFSTVPRGGALRAELECGLPCSGKMQAGRFAGVQVCHRSRQNQVVIHGDTRENVHLGEAYRQRLLETYGNEAFVDELIGGQWASPGQALLPGWGNVGIEWGATRGGTFHLAVDFGSLTGHALLIEEVPPTHPGYPHDRSTGNTCYIVVDEMRSPTTAPEHFPELVLSKWKGHRITRVFGDQAGLQVSGAREKKTRGLIIRRSTYLQAWNAAIRRHQRRHVNLPVREVEYTTDKHSTALAVSVPWLSGLISDVNRRSRYFWSTALQGRQYGKLPDPDRRILYGIVAQGREYAKDRHGNIPGHDRGMRWDGIDALRYHALGAIGTPPKPTARFAPDTLGITH